MIEQSIIHDQTTRHPAEADDNPLSSPWPRQNPVAMSIHNLSAGYNDLNAIRNVFMNIYAKTVTAIIGPSGCGKSTLIRCFNRMHEVIPSARHEGDITLDGKDIFSMDPVALRQKVGMVFQRPNPFPTFSVFQNVAAGLCSTTSAKKRSFSRSLRRPSRRPPCGTRSKTNSILRG